MLSSHQVRGLPVRPSILAEVSAVIRYIREYLDNLGIPATLTQRSVAAFLSMTDESHTSDSYVAELHERAGSSARSCWNICLNLQPAL